MKSYSILFSWIVTILMNQALGLTHYQLKISIKKTYSGNLLEIGAKNFKDLVLNSCITVDKSLLVTSVVGPESVVKLTYPRKWGKSMNLGMFRSFFEMQINSKGDQIPSTSTWGYKYFKNGVITDEDGLAQNLINPPVIAQYEDFINEHLAKYPVLFIDLSATLCEANTFDKFFHSFRRTVGSIYDKYDYLVDVLQDRIDNATVLKKPNEQLKSLLEKFQKYKKVKEDNFDEMAKSLDFLSTILYEEFGRRVFVMIDDYDALIKKAYLQYPSNISDDEASKFLDFHVSLLQHTFAKDKNVSRKGFLTGIYSLNLGLTHLAPNQTIHYNILNKNAYPFYGFTEVEANQMLKHAGVPENKIKEALAYYDGYYMGDFPDIVIRNPWSIVNFLLHDKIQNYWLSAMELEIPSHLLKHENVSNMFISLIGRSVDAQIYRHDLTLNRSDIVLLRKIIISDNESASLDHQNFGLIFILYFATGILTLDFHPHCTHLSNEIHMKIPCREVETEIIDELVTYQEKFLGPVISTLANASAESLIFDVPNTKVAILKRKLKKFYDVLFDTSYQISKQRLIDSAHFLMLLYVRRSSHFEYYVGLNASYYSKTDERKLRPYIIMYGKENATLIGFKWSHEKPQDYVFESALSSINKDLSHALPKYKSHFVEKSLKYIHYVHIYYVVTTKELSIAKDVEKID